MLKLLKKKTILDIIETELNSCFDELLANEDRRDFYTKQVEYFQDKIQRLNQHKTSLQQWRVSLQKDHEL